MNRLRQLPKGHVSILSPAFKYVRAASTDLAKTFARIRARFIHEGAFARGQGSATGTDALRPGRLDAMERIEIRAIRPRDKPRIVDAFAALEPETVYRRFLFHKAALSEEELRRLTEADGVREAALVAAVEAGDGERIVGLGRYVGDGRAAEIAFTVAEDYQGRGIATRLLRDLARIARRNGIRQFEADVQAGNASMLSVLRHAGLRVAERAEDGVVHLTLDLGEQ
jgi:RimJ/RimL family protein N-acetyltransferase